MIVTCSNRELFLKGTAGGGSPGLVVMGADSCSMGREFKSLHHKMDGFFSHLLVVEIVMFG